MPTNSGTINQTPVNPYCEASEIAVAAQRPSQTRKKPVKRAAGFLSGTGSEQTLIFGQWMTGKRGQAASQSE